MYPTCSSFENAPQKSILRSELNEPVLTGGHNDGTGREPILNNGRRTVSSRHLKTKIYDVEYVETSRDRKKGQWGSELSKKTKNIYVEMFCIYKSKLHSVVLVGTCGSPAMMK